MELDSYFLLVEYIVEIKQVVNCDEWHWENVAVAGKESLKVFIGHVCFVEIFQLYYVKILSRVEKFVCIVSQNRTVLVSVCIPLGEVVTQED